MSNHFNELIKRFDTGGDLDEFRAWAQAQAGDDRATWEGCPAGDWLLWMAASVGMPRASVVRAALRCLEIDRELMLESRGLLHDFTDACGRWLSNGDGLEDIRRISEDLYEQLVSTHSGLTRATIKFIDACVWIGNLVIDEPDNEEECGSGSADASEVMGAYGKSGLMAVASISAAYACHNVGEDASDPRWQHCFQTARGMCADAVRAAIHFEEIQRVAARAGVRLI